MKKELKGIKVKHDGVTFLKHPNGVYTLNFIEWDDKGETMYLVDLILHVDGISLYSSKIENGLKDVGISECFYFSQRMLMDEFSEKDINSLLDCMVLIKKITPTLYDDFKTYNEILKVIRDVEENNSDKKYNK